MPSLRLKTNERSIISTKLVNKKLEGTMKDFLNTQVLRAHYAQKL